MNLAFPINCFMLWSILAGRVYVQVPPQISQFPLIMSPLFLDSNQLKSLMELLGIGPHHSYDRGIWELPFPVTL